MTDKHYGHLVTIARELGECGCTKHLIMVCNAFAENISIFCTDQQMIKAVSTIYNAISIFCALYGIEDDVQNMAEKQAEAMVLKMMQNAE